MGENLGDKPFVRCSGGRDGERAAIKGLPRMLCKQMAVNRLGLQS